MDPSSEIMVDHSPVFRIYKDLRVERLMGDDNDTVPAGYDSSTGVTSKDVTIDGDTGVYVRLYLPDMAVVRSSSSDDNNKRLPVLVYYHGGGFVTFSAASPIYHAFLNSLAAKAGVLLVSVNHRLATEHPFPIGYEDSFRALQWVLLSPSSSGSDPWLSRHGDLGRVFLAGDSAGGNIAHNVAMMAAGRMDPDDLSRIEGVVLLHSAFWGKDHIAGETPATVALMETLWSVVCPEATDGVDDPRINPLSAAAAPSLKNLPCKRLLVCAADGDFFFQRTKAYYEGVAASGWGGRLEWFESKDAGHCFFIGEPDGREGVVLMNRLVAFIAGDNENQ